MLTQHNWGCLHKLCILKDDSGVTLWTLVSECAQLVHTTSFVLGEHGATALTPEWQCWCALAVTPHSQVLSGAEVQLRFVSVKNLTTQEPLASYFGPVYPSCGQPD